MDSPVQSLQRLRETQQVAPGPVVYWMQASQRCLDNTALSWALLRASTLAKSLRIVWIGMGGLPLAPDFSFEFMRQGLSELALRFKALGLSFELLLIAKSEAISPAVKILEYVKLHNAALLVCDHGPLRWQRNIKQQLIEGLDALRLACELHVVEANTLIPVTSLADKALWSAASARPRVHSLYARIFNNTLPELDALAAQLPPADVTLQSPPGWQDAGVLHDPKAFFQALGRQPGYISSIKVKGGEAAALQRLDDFIDHGLAAYALKRSDPLADAQSGLSAYLHFGQLSPAHIVRQLESRLHELDTRNNPVLSGILMSTSASKVQPEFTSGSIFLDRIIAADRRGDFDEPQLQTAEVAGAASFFEELVVRRELAVNWVWFNTAYDRYEGLPEWARNTLEAHRRDTRPSVYSYEQLALAQTHDRYWNAAQLQMLQSGIMHGYMRMYWGKKILEWSKTPEEAFETALRLNDSYMLDGRDANGYAGVAWCFGAHDRPWTERSIFGTVRYMNDKGLERKFDIKTWAKRWLGEAGDAPLFS